VPWRRLPPTLRSGSPRGRPRIGRLRRRGLAPPPPEVPPPGVRGRPLGVAVLFLSVLIASFGGAADLPVGGVALALLDKLLLLRFDTGLSPIQLGILNEIRLPRVVLATLVGALLARPARPTRASSATRCPTPGRSAPRPGRDGGDPGDRVRRGSEASFGGIGAVPLAAFVGALAGVLASYLLGRSPCAAAGRRR